MSREPLQYNQWAVNFFPYTFLSKYLFFIFPSNFFSTFSSTSAYMGCILALLLWPFLSFGSFCSHRFLFGGLSLVGWQVVGFISYIYYFTYFLKSIGEMSRAEMNGQNLCMGII